MDHDHLFQLVGGKTHAPELEINSNVDLDAVWDTATNSDIEANLYSFFTYQETSGPSGRGYLGKVCSSTRRRRTHITERLRSIIRTSNVICFDKTTLYINITLYFIIDANSRDWPQLGHAS